MEDKEQTQKINEIESLDKYFPKGDKSRGDALVLAAEAFLLGRDLSKTLKEKQNG